MGSFSMWHLFILLFIVVVPLAFTLGIIFIVRARDARHRRNGTAGSRQPDLPQPGERFPPATPPRDPH